METRSIYLSHQPGGSVVTMPTGRRRIVAGAQDLAQALRDASSLLLERPPIVPEPAGKRIDVEPIEGGLIATLPRSDGPGEQFVIPDDSIAAGAQLWDALTGASPGKLLHDVERLAFEDGDDDDRVNVPIGDVAEINVSRAQLRAGTRAVRGFTSILRFVSRPGPKAREREAAKRKGKATQ